MHLIPHNNTTPNQSPCCDPWLQIIENGISVEGGRTNIALAQWVLVKSLLPSLCISVGSDSTKGKIFSVLSDGCPEHDCYFIWYVSININVLYPKPTLTKFWFYFLNLCTWKWAAMFQIKLRVLSQFPFTICSVSMDFPLSSFTQIPCPCKALIAT